MNTDFRVSVGLPGHHKTAKLIRRIGKDGVCSLVFLWAYVAQHRPDGRLTGIDAEDIAIIAKWDGDPEEFVNVLVDVGFIDRGPDCLIIHDWTNHNGYASSAHIRSEAARQAVQKRWQKRLSDATAIRNGYDSNTDVLPPYYGSDTQSENRNTPYPNPNPNPNPNPEPNPKPSRKKREKKPVREIDQEFLDDLAARYPRVNIENERALALEWIEDHPGRKMSRSFLRGWIDRTAKRIEATNPQPLDDYDGPFLNRFEEESDRAGRWIVEQLEKDDELARQRAEEEKKRNANNAA